MKVPPSFDDGQPSGDHTFANALIGKHVFVGVTRQDANGKILTRKQFHGEATVADPQKGFCIKLRGTRKREYEWLPPDTRAFLVANPGKYRLRSIAVVVVDQDFTSSWTITELEKGSA